MGGCTGRAITNGVLYGVRAMVPLEFMIKNAVLDPLYGFALPKLLEYLILISLSSKLMKSIHGF